METANYMYKCRMCGKVYGNVHGNVDMANMILYDIINDTDFIDIHIGTKPKMLDTHVCDESRFGVADFIGYKISDD